MNVGSLPINSVTQALGAALSQLQPSLDPRPANSAGFAGRVVIAPDFFDTSQYKQDGDFDRLNKLFGGRLEAILGEIGDEIWRCAG